ncbi:MAG: MutS-related protein [Terracidiphilus sp.]
MDESQKAAQAEPPREAYTRLRAQAQARIARLVRWDRGLGYAKIADALAGALLLIRYVHLLHGVWTLVAAAAVFAALAVAHDRVLGSIGTLKSIVAFYERGLARLEDRWAGAGEGGERFLDPAHPYARDLDIFGQGSLFELLSTVRTRAGEETLAHWLLTPAPPDEVAARQAALRELAPRVQLRERLFTAGQRVRLGLRPDALTAWAERETRFASPWLALPFAVLAVAWMAIAVYGLYGLYIASAYGSYTVFYEGIEAIFAISVINYAASGYFRRRLKASAHAIEEAAEDLDLLAQILTILEGEPFSAPRLKTLQSALHAEKIAPSAAVRRLDRIAQSLESAHNLMVAVIDPFIFWTSQFTLLAESWRKRFGPSIRGWLNAVGELEALAALSGYAFENPDNSWPQLESDAPCFEAESLGHPLMPAGKAVRNDFALGSGLQLIILSGPNMAGKSTLVRAIGVNAVLAQCGAPVRAARLRMSPLAVGASICVLDSLQGGVSRFYAEIKRLKLISDLARGPIAVLFLLDELLSGTNSRDRLAGTEFIVRALVEHGAMGMVTTHDLALAQIPDTMNGAARNYHFEDRLEEGKLVFDYKLKPGVVQTSNALKLMQSIGLVSE